MATIQKQPKGQSRPEGNVPTLPSGLADLNSQRKPANLYDRFFKGPLNGLKRRANGLTASPSNPNGEHLQNHHAKQPGSRQLPLLKSAVISTPNGKLQRAPSVENSIHDDHRTDISQGTRDKRPLREPEDIVPASTIDRLKNPVLPETANKAPTHHSLPRAQSATAAAAFPGQASPVQVKVPPETTDKASMLLPAKSSEFQAVSTSDADNEKRSRTDQKRQQSEHVTDAGSAVELQALDKNGHSIREDLTTKIPQKLRQLANNDLDIAAERYTVALQNKEKVAEGVWNPLRHHLKGHEKMSSSITIEIEPRLQKRTLVIVTCRGCAAERVKDVRSILQSQELHLRSLGPRGFELKVIEDQTYNLFYAGPSPEDAHASESTYTGVHEGVSYAPSSDTTRTWLDTDGVREPESTDLRTENGDIEIVINEARAPAPLRAHTGRGTIRFVDNAREHVLQGERKNQEARFANLPYWTSSSIPVECLFRPKSQSTSNTLCGALLRMNGLGDYGEPNYRTWTCGGIIYVNGTPYGLTTSHPFVFDGLSDDLDHKGLPSVTDHTLQALRSDRADKEEFGDNPDATSWQDLGQVHKHALSKIGFVPANNDWLLIDIAKHHVLPNLLARAARVHRPGSIKMAIRTWRDTLDATLLGKSFIIIGDSPFEAMRLAVTKPIIRGDSGSWVMEDDQAKGVVIAGGTDEKDGTHLAYAINMEDVCRSIAIGMDNASIHIPTSTENAILAYQVTHEGEDTADLAALYIQHLARTVAREGSPAVNIKLSTGVYSSGSLLQSMLTLGRLCPPPSAHFRTSREMTARSKSRALHAILRAGKGLIGGKLSRDLRKYEECRTIDALDDLAYSLGLDRHRRARLIQHIMSELGISPMPSIPQFAQLLRQSRVLPDHRRDGFVINQDKVVSLTDMSKILARLFFAVRVGAFFVYCGPWADWLEDRCSWYLNVGIIGLGSTLKGRNLEPTRDLDDYEWTSHIQAFVVSTDLSTTYREARSAFHTHGDIVEYPELRDLLSRLSSRNVMFSRID